MSFCSPGNAQHVEELLAMFPQCSKDEACRLLESRGYTGSIDFLLSECEVALILNPLNTVTKTGDKAAFQMLNKSEIVQDELSPTEPAKQRQPPIIAKDSKVPSAMTLTIDKYKSKVKDPATYEEGDEELLAIDTRQWSHTRRREAQAMARMDTRRSTITGASFDIQLEVNVHLGLKSKSEMASEGCRTLEAGRKNSSSTPFICLDSTDVGEKTFHDRPPVGKSSAAPITLDSESESEGCIRPSSSSQAFAKCQSSFNGKPLREEVDGEAFDSWVAEAGSQSGAALDSQPVAGPFLKSKLATDTTNGGSLRRCSGLARNGKPLEAVSISCSAEARRFPMSLVDLTDDSDNVGWNSSEDKGKEVNCTDLETEKCKSLECSRKRSLDKDDCDSITAEQMDGFFAKNNRRNEWRMGSFDNRDRGGSSHEDRFQGEGIAEQSFPIEELKGVKHVPKRRMVGDGGKDKSKVEKEAEKVRLAEEREGRKVAAALRKEEEKAARKALAEQQKAAKIQDKQKKKEEERNRKELNKAEKKLHRVKDAARRNKTCIDRGLLQGPVFAATISALTEKEYPYDIVQSPVPRSVVWRLTRHVADSPASQSQPSESSQRANSDSQDSLFYGPTQSFQVPTVEEEQPYVLVIWEAAHFTALVTGDKIDAEICKVRERYPLCTVCFLIHGLTQFLRKEKQQQYNSALGSSYVPPQVGRALARLAVYHDKVHSRVCANEHEVADHVVGLHRTLAEAPHRQKLSRFQINQNGGLGNKADPLWEKAKTCCWTKMLLGVPGVAIRDAIAIAERYPSMGSLLRAYFCLPTERERERMLEGLSRQQEGSVLSTRGKIGATVSKKVYRVLTAADGAMTAAQAMEAVRTVSPRLF